MPRNTRAHDKHPASVLSCLGLAGEVAGCGRTHVDNDFCLFMLGETSRDDVFSLSLSSPSLSASHSHMQTVILSLPSQSLTLAVSFPPLSLSFSPPLCAEVCVQTDCSKMAAAEPAGFCCAACPPLHPLHPLPHPPLPGLSAIGAK